MNITLNEDQAKALANGANTLLTIERNFRDGLMDFYISDLNKIMCLQYEIVRMLNLKSEVLTSDWVFQDTKAKRKGARK
jgi:hypothetical protein